MPNRPGLRRRTLDILDRLLDAFPPVRRARFWAWLLRKARPDSVRDARRLLTSAVGDVFRYSLAPSRHPVPQVRQPLVLRPRGTDTRFAVRADTDDIYHVLPGREADVHDAILGLLEPGDTFVDVGANIGYYTVRGATCVGHRGAVVAVEAFPDTAAALRKNIMLNGLRNVTVVEAAATDGRRHEVDVAVPGTRYGQARLTADPGEAATRVRATTLDAECAGLDRVRVLKLDVEGSELDALRGAGELLSRTEHVIVECNEDAVEIEALLRGHGLQVRRLAFTTHRLAHRGSSPARLLS